MTVPRNLRLLDVDQLADECAEHTAKFFSRTIHETGYCYELFRRAIVDRNSYAWEKIYQNYQPLAASWARRHNGLQDVDEEVDYFVNGAFDKMWSAMDAEKFKNSKDVADLLRYLKMCVHSVIVDHARAGHTRTLSLEAFAHLPDQDLPSIEKRVTDQIEGERLWQTAVDLTHDEKEAIVLQFSFVYGFKPSEIYATYPDRFDSMDEIYRTKRNLLNRLRRNPIMQQFGSGYHVPSVLDQSESETAYDASPGTEHPRREDHPEPLKEQISPTLRRFTDIRFPEQCKIYEPVQLSVQLTLNPAQIEVGILPPTELELTPAVEELQRKELVELTVVVSADNFEIDRRWQKILVPFDEDSEKIVFELIGQELGPQIVEIEFYQGTARVGYVVAETRVVDSTTLGQDDLVTYEHPDDQRILFSTQKQSNITIIVDWRRTLGNDREIKYFTIDKNKHRWPIDYDSVIVEGGEERVKRLWKDLSDIVGELVQVSVSGNRLKSIWLNLIALGKELGEVVIPPKLLSDSATWPEGSIIMVSTNEEWIPWELIYDGNKFWGEKFVLARIPRIPGYGAFHASDEAVKRNAPLRLSKIVNVIGGKLKPESILDQISCLFANIQAKSVRVESIERATLAELSQALEEADLIHFTCHGHTEPPRFQLADNHSLMYCLTPINLKALPEMSDSIVFANTCSSAIITSFLGELRNFGWEFYKKGTAAYIGTLGLVPTVHAVAFAQEFYKWLLDDHTVGGALRYAKSQVEQEKNPFWLLYSLYGDPFARKAITSQRQSPADTDQQMPVAKH